MPRGVRRAALRRRCDIPVITIAGGLGSGAREIAQAVARELKLDYVDQEILVEAARELGVSVATVERHDERASTLAERLGSMMRTLMERSAAAGAGDPAVGGGLDVVLARTYGEAAELPSEPQPVGQLDDERYLSTLTSVIKGVASRGNVVLLGRGSQAILQREEDALHVFVYLPKRQRIGAVVAQQGMTEQEAERRVKASDGNRTAFYQRYFKTNQEAPQLYDLIVNADRLRADLAVKLIALAVRDRTPRPG